MRAAAGGWGEKNQQKLGRPQQLYQSTPQGERALMFDRSLFRKGADR